MCHVYILAKNVKFRLFTGSWDTNLQFMVSKCRWIGDIPYASASRTVLTGKDLIFIFKLLHCYNFWNNKTVETLVWLTL